MNSRNKGKRGERQAAAYLRALGFPSARRGAQHRGGRDSPDVLADELSHVHIEVKHRAGIDLGTVELDNAMAQADTDAGADREPVVLWKRNRTAWRLTWIECGVQLTTTGDVEIAGTLRRLNAADGRQTPATGNGRGGGIGGDFFRGCETLDRPASIVIFLASFHKNLIWRFNMGKRGPLGMTADAAKRRGSYRIDRHGGKHITPGEPPKRPPWLDGEAAAIWDDLLPPLIAAGIPLRSVDAFALARYCSMLEWWRQCQADIEAHGSTFTNARGREVERPAVRQAATLADGMLRIEREYGMSPTARARLPLVDPKPDDAGPIGIAKYLTPTLRGDA
ncbi:MAG: phage terminase small subunit P27 family [Phycisphaerales bacterium]